MEKRDKTKREKKLNEDEKSSSRKVKQKNVITQKERTDQETRRDGTNLQARCDQMRKGELSVDVIWGRSSFLVSFSSEA